MIDSHTHLEKCEGAEAEVVERARAAGLTRILTIGLDVESSRRALDSASRFPEVFAAVGFHPNNDPAITDDDLGALAELASHELCKAVGETGLDDYRDSSTLAAQRPAFIGQIEIARKVNKPLVIHMRGDATAETLQILRREATGLEVILHCFSIPEQLQECAAEGWWISFAGQVTYPKNTALAAVVAEVPADRLLVETDAPYLTPQPQRKHRNEPAFVTHTAQFVAERRGISYDELDALVTANAERLFGWMRPSDPGPEESRSDSSKEPSAERESPAQPSIRRLQAFSIHPRRDLGQNFLIDSNILGVIEQGAELGPDDVVLEIGGGLGVLSEHLAAVARHTHVVEIDGDLQAPLREALQPFAGKATLHMQDALMLDYAALDPQPTKVVANLPYNIAATVLLDTIFALPQVELWIGMVQKEVGERFAARAGGPDKSAYGIPSVLAQLACDVDVYRRVSRRVFHPVPNVDSVLLRMRRTGPAPEPELRGFVQGAFSHRRKAMARSLQLHTHDPGIREAVRGALAAAGLPEDSRAERLTPTQFRDLFSAVTSR